MVWEGIYKVEVEVTEELGIVFEYHQDDSDCGSVERLHRCQCFLPNHHVLL